MYFIQSVAIKLVMLIIFMLSVIMTRVIILMSRILPLCLVLLCQVLLCWVSLWRVSWRRSVKWLNQEFQTFLLFQTSFSSLFPQNSTFSVFLTLESSPEREIKFAMSRIRRNVIQGYSNFKIFSWLASK
jgi:hypothetical protein